MAEPHPFRTAPLDPRPLICLLMLATLALPSAGNAEGAGPEAALGWLDPEIAAATTEVDLLAARLTPWGQVDYSARLRPLLRYNEYPGDGDTGNLTARLGVSAVIDFTDPPATHARSHQRLERARQVVFLLHSRGIRDALLAHAYLLIAQEQEVVARRSLEAGEAQTAGAGGTAGAKDGTEDRGADRAEDGAGDGGGDRLEDRGGRGKDRGLRAARLEWRMAAHDHDEALQDLDEARGSARAYGLSTQAGYRPLRFVLPGPEVEEFAHRQSHDYRMLELKLLEAEAELGEAESRPLDDLRVRGAYRGRGAQLELEGGIVNGGPGATLGLKVPGGSWRWQLEISAELVLDDGWLGLPRLEDAVAAAREDLASYRDAYRQEFAQARAGAELAEEALDLAEIEVALLEEVAAERQAELAAVSRANGDGGESRRAGARQAVARAERDLSRARIRLYRAWVGYIREAARLLELTGASWDARSDVTSRPAAPTAATDKPHRP